MESKPVANRRKAPAAQTFSGIVAHQHSSFNMPSSTSRNPEFVRFGSFGRAADAVLKSTPPTTVIKSQLG